MELCAASECFNSGTGRGERVAVLSERYFPPGVLNRNTLTIKYKVEDRGYAKTDSEKGAGGRTRSGKRKTKRAASRTEEARALTNNNELQSKEQARQNPDTWVERWVVLVSTADDGPAQ